MFDEIDMDNLISEYRRSCNYVKRYTNDFPQLDNLVDAIPSSAEPGVPYVGDTTLAGLVRSIPRDSLQQLPVFSCAVNGTKLSLYALMCKFFLKKYVFNEDTFGKGLLSTLQIGAEQALTHGYAPFQVATGNMYKDFGTTLRLLHYSDNSLEPGISDSNESNYHYAVSNLTDSKIRKILKRAELNPETSWNTKALEQLLTTPPTKRIYSTEVSKARQLHNELDNNTYEIVTRFEVGSGGSHVTFCPSLQQAPLRVVKSKSKWGYPRVLYLVIDPAPLIPFGISRVRLASPIQNLLNIYFGNVASMLLLNSKPPILQRGNFAEPIRLKQSALWRALDPDASADLKMIDNGTLTQFPNILQQLTGQIQNIMGGKTATLNAGSKVSGFSKTAPGVRQAEKFDDAGTNQITKILENFLRQYALVALDTIISEQVGVEKVIVDDETKDAINMLEPELIGEDNTIEIDWQEFYDAIQEWSVEIDVSVSKDELDEKKRGDLQDMLVVLAQNAQNLGPGVQQQISGITKMLLKDKAPLIGETMGDIQPPQPIDQMPQDMPQVPPQMG